MGAWIEIGTSPSVCKYTPVAPHVGAWIEIEDVSSGFTVSESHPTWVRGLKFLFSAKESTIFDVAPHVGAWIEIVIDCPIGVEDVVAPHVGAWIEIKDWR